MTAVEELTIDAVEESTQVGMAESVPEVVAYVQCGLSCPHNDGGFCKEEQRHTTQHRCTKCDQMWW
jgi:hypothetical protein